MRIRLDFEDQLLHEVKQEAARRGQTLSAFIADALRESLARRQQARQTAPTRLLTVKGRLMPGVDLSNNVALLDLLDEERDVAHRR